MNGVILDFELAPANESDLAVGFELLSEHTDLQVLGDKAYISAAKAAQLWQENRIHSKPFLAAINKSNCHTLPNVFTTRCAR